MKRFVVACVGVLACAQMSARAADIPARYPMPYRAPVYGAVYNWTGFYLGINGGGGWGRSQWDGIDKFNISGGLIGGTVGYNWQINQLVIGAEGDIDWSGVRGTTNVLCPPGCESRNSWLATARASATRSIDSCRISPRVWRSATSARAFPVSPAAASPTPDGPWAVDSNSAS